ncbi:MAG: hypothetical protein HYZ47_05540 [Simkania negevensis]|nr:hypothetical protein [Simkania negevensis]
MITLTKTRAFILSGVIWLAIGTLLIYKGTFFILEELHLLLAGTLPPFSLILFFSHFSGNFERATLFLFSFSFLIGLLKGRFALKKTAGRVIQRIAFQGSSLSWKSLYSKPYLILLGLMFLLGMSLKYLPFPLGVRGGIDFVVGVALIYGSFFYFKSVFIYSKEIFTQDKQQN